MAQYLPGSVVYAFTAEDRAAYRDALASEQKKTGAVFGFGAVFFMLAGLFETALSAASFAHASVFGRVREANPASSVLGPIYVVMGIVWAFRARDGIVAWFGLPKLVSGRTMAWDETGITFSGGGVPSRTMPWRLVRSVRYVGGSVAIVRQLTSDVVPIRAFPDGGGDFMMYVDDRIVGKRLLVRPQPSAR